MRRKLVYIVNQQKPLPTSHHQTITEDFIILSKKMNCSENALKIISENERRLSVKYSEEKH